MNMKSDLLEDIKERDADIRIRKNIYNRDTQ